MSNPYYAAASAVIALVVFTVLLVLFAPAPAANTNRHKTFEGECIKRGGMLLPANRIPPFYYDCVPSCNEQHKQLKTKLLMVR